MGETRSGEEGTNIHGLFGAIAVEEAGATFHDTRTGKKINYGTKAVIKRPDGSSSENLHCLCMILHCCLTRTARH